MTVVMDIEVLREVIEALTRALEERGVEILTGGLSEDGDVYLECRLPQAGTMGADRFMLNLSNTIRDVVLVDRDQPWLGIDERILSTDGRARKIQQVVAHRMAVVEAMMQTDEREFRRRLKAVGQNSGRLRVWKMEKGKEPKLAFWYENGEPVQ